MSKQKNAQNFIVFSSKSLPTSSITVSIYFPLCLKTHPVTKKWCNAFCGVESTWARKIDIENGADYPMIDLNFVVEQQMLTLCVKQ